MGASYVLVAIQTESEQELGYGESVRTRDGLRASLGSKGCARDTRAKPDPEVALLLWRPWSPAGEFGRCDGRPAELRPGGEGSPERGRLTAGRPTAHGRPHDQPGAGLGRVQRWRRPHGRHCRRRGFEVVPLRAGTVSVRGGEAVSQTQS